MLRLPPTHRIRPLFLGFCWLLIVFHAVAMPIQYDEAVTILSVREHGVLSAFTRYDAGTNNHPLLSLLIGLLLHTGVTHAAFFRLPSLFGALAVLVCADRLGRHLTPTVRVLLPLIVSLPLFFDYLVLARGYALGLAFLLWGILAFWRSVVLSGLLFGLSALFVPTYALDVAVAGAGLLLAREDWRRVIAAVGLGAGLSLVGYAAILVNVVTVLDSLSAESKAAVLHGFVAALTGYGVWIGGALLVLGIVLATWTIRGRSFITVAFLLSVVLLPFGYARTHLFSAILLVLVLLSFLPVRRWTIAVLLLFCIGSLLLLPSDRIASEPETWPVSGFSVARSLSTCLAVQKRGLFAVPHRFYEELHAGPPFNADCLHFLMVAQPSLKIPPGLRLHPDKLSAYGVEMYRRNDLNRLLHLQAELEPPRIQGSEYQR